MSALEEAKPCWPRPRGVVVTYWSVFLILLQEGERNKNVKFNNYLIPCGWLQGSGGNLFLCIIKTNFLIPLNGIQYKTIMGFPKVKNKDAGF